MIRRAAVIQHVARADVEALFQRVDGRICLHQLFNVIGQKLLDQSGQIGIVIIKGIARDAAVGRDILDGDLIDRLAVEQLDKGILYGFLR